MKTSAINYNLPLAIKGIFYTLMFLTSSIGFAQNTVMVNYSSTTAAFPNPERGFYKHNEVRSSNYVGLNQSTLNGYRSSNITLLLRLFYLEGFVNGPISSSYLSNMQADFNKIRSAGLKCVLRFAYSDNTNGVLDAPKAVVLNHIAQLKPFLTNNADVIAAVQAGFIGSWGEWYYTSNFGQNPTSADFANRREVVNALLGAIPNRMIEMRTPSLKQKTFNSTAPLPPSQAFSGSTLARLGHHNDCFLASASDFGTYVNPGTEYPYLAQETTYTVMGGETCAVNEPRSKCTTALSEMQKFHYSYLNIDYNASVIGGFQSESCFSSIQNGLGYRFELVNALFPKTGNVGSPLALTLNVKNNGFASLYNQRTVYLILRNSSSNKEYSIPLQTDPRYWTAGVQQTITENVTLPEDITTGDYKLYLSLPDADLGLKIRPEYSIRLANNNIWESNTGYNNLLYTINIQPKLGVDDLENNKTKMVIYAVPGIDEMIVEMDGLNNYKMTVFNTLGQKVNVDFSATSNKIIIDTQSLSSGIYFLQFQSGTSKETRKIIVNH